VAAPRDAEQLSPNQMARRDQIVGAAVDVLLAEGVHACTVRAIAARAGVSKGVVHYYFADVDEVVDMAMVHATNAWIAWLRAAGDAGAGPAERFWRAVRASLEPFAQGDRTIMPLWLEYWSARTRAGRVAPLAEVQGLLVAYMRELLEAAGVTDAARRAQAVTGFLFGVAMQHALVPVELDAVARDVAALAGLEPPD
jgi:AcrR family transcriptional regulator